MGFTVLKQTFIGKPEELEKTLELIEKDDAFFPFNEYEYLIWNLIEIGGLTYKQYLDIRTE